VGEGCNYLCAERSLSVLIVGHRVADHVHPAAGHQVTPGPAEPPKIGAELAGVGEPGPVGGLVEGEGLRHVWHRAAEQPKAHPARRIQDDGLNGDRHQAGSDRGAVRGQHHLTGAEAAYASLFEDDLDGVYDRLDAALLEAAAYMRREPSAEIIEFPERSADEVLTRLNVSAPPVGFEPTTQGLGNLCSIP
jgi:hypothetical protein